MGYKNIIGHEEIIKTFDITINNNRFSHAHIFLGEDGIGKSVIAKSIAIKLIGETEYKDYVDIFHFKLEKNKSSIGVNATRALIEEINKKPYKSEKKVIIIHEGHKMTVQAQNALLKTIEEPPKDVFIFILCENIENMLDTIKSRCQIHKFNRLSEDDMRTYLQINYPNLSDDDVTVLLSFSSGIPGKAEFLMNNEDFRELRDKVINIILNLKNMKELDIFKEDEFFSKNSNMWEDIVDVFISFIRDTIIYKEVGCEELIINKDKLTEIKQCANMFSFTKLSDIISIINETRENIDRNVNSLLAFDVMLLKMQEV
ncbi:DNA polymerase III subunit delta' [uncultured Clostridium sp.]|uniref:DNA polymerase III subunit delta' n=1 Tax=uncultured Clostridium sp. TaxID=59620 RepID=UPI002589B1EB|nr:DNA polymerase III subunit delta' [uncultured Clostridium sp.]MDU1348575.1 DNA polymerase III subunit delta' [Clostridium argentinense]